MLLTRRTLQLVFLSLVLATAGIQPALAAESEAYRIARGGRLYDNWFAEKGQEAPSLANPAYPETGNYRGKKGADWRCKECHGWDYLGKEGAYGSGKHATGFPGIKNARPYSLEQTRAILGNPAHGYNKDMLSDVDMEDLALFLNRGQIDMLKYIDKSTLRAAGDHIRGKSHYQTLCASCHGLDGKAMGEEAELGKLSRENPWEVLHKIRHGQPKSTMPSLASLDIAIIVDILTYLQEQLRHE